MRVESHSVPLSIIPLPVALASGRSTLWELDAVKG
jgi:hypothetical protein